MIYFIHGLNGFAAEWKPFIEYFKKKGYQCNAVELKEGMNLRKTCFQDYVDKIISMVSKDDILIGHSMGGLIVQKVMEATKIKAGVCTCPAPPKGIDLRSLSFLSQIRYMPFIIARIPFLPTFSLAQDRFLNDLSEIEARKRYKLLQKQSAKVTYEVLKQKVSVDEKKISSPMFFIARQNDLMISPSIVKRVAEKYNASMKTFPGNHNIFSDSELISNEIYNFIKSLS